MAILNPRQLPATNVRTSDPLSLALGLPLFPIDGKDLVIPAAIDPSGTLLDKSVGDRIAGVDLNIGYSLFLGLAGPSWATEVEVEGVYGGYDQGGNALFFSKTSGDQLLAGLVFGANMGINFNVSANVGPVSLNESFTINFDLIAVAALIIGDIIGTQTTFGKVSSGLTSSYPQLASSWGFFGATSGSYAQNGGSLSASAPFNFPVNLWAGLVLAAELVGDFFGVGEAITAANDAFGATGSSLMIGYTVGLGITVTPRIIGLTLDGVVFGGVAFGGTSMTGATNSPLPESPTRVGFVFEQKNSLDVELGLATSLTILAVFTLGASISFDVTKLFPQVGLGTFTQQLQSPINQPVAIRVVEFV